VEAGSSKEEVTIDVTQAMLATRSRVICPYGDFNTQEILLFIRLSNYDCDASLVVGAEEAYLLVWFSVL